MKLKFHPRDFQNSPVLKLNILLQLSQTRLLKANLPVRKLILTGAETPVSFVMETENA